MQGPGLPCLVLIVNRTSSPALEGTLREEDLVTPDKPCASRHTWVEGIWSGGQGGGPRGQVHTANFFLHFPRKSQAQGHSLTGVATGIVQICFWGGT